MIALYQAQEQNLCKSRAANSNLNSKKFGCFAEVELKLEEKKFFCVTSNSKLHSNKATWIH